MKYLIYTKLDSVCPYCVKALALLDEQGIQYEEIKMPADEEFLASITTPVDSSIKVNKRFSKIEQLLKELKC